MTDSTKEIIAKAKSQARAEAFKNLLNNNRKALKIAIAVVIIAVILILALNAFKKANQVKFSKIFHQTLIDQQAGEVDKAKAGLKTIYEAKSAPNGVRSLAALRYAAIFINEGNKSEAVKIYLEIAKCRSCDSQVSDLSALLAVKIMVADKDESKKADLAARIEKIENSAKGLRYYIAEQRALLEIKQNNLEKSYQIFELISQNPESSQSLKDRAKEALKMIISKGFEPKPVTKK